jgi:hypothetical protein
MSRLSHHGLPAQVVDAVWDESNRIPMLAGAVPVAGSGLRCAWCWQ